jgi:hypothetical protein
MNYPTVSSANSLLSSPVLASHRVGAREVIGTGRQPFRKPAGLSPNRRRTIISKNRSEGGIS